VGLKLRRPPEGRSRKRMQPRRTAFNVRRLASAALPLVQLTAAATAAWVLARQLSDQEEPFSRRLPWSWL